MLLSIGTGVAGLADGEITFVGEPGHTRPLVGVRTLKCAVTLAGLVSDGTGAALGVEIAAMATDVAVLDIAPAVGVKPVEIGEGSGLDTKGTRMGEAIGWVLIVV